MFFHTPLRMTDAGTCKGKVVKIRKMAAHNGLAFGKDSGQKLHSMQLAANKKQKMQRKAKPQSKQHGKRKRSEDAALQPK